MPTLNHRQLTTTLLIAAISFCLCACTSLSIGEPGEAAETRHYFGYVRLVTPGATPMHLQALRTEVAGLSLGRNLVIGWEEREDVLVPLRINETGEGDQRQPYEATCSLVVIIRSDAEAQHARQILNDIIKEEDICLADFRSGEPSAQKP